MKEDSPITHADFEEFAPNNRRLSDLVYNRLTTNGFDAWSDIDGCCECQLLDIRGLGQGSFDLILEAAESRGFEILKHTYECKVYGKVYGKGAEWTT